MGSLQISECSSTRIRGRLSSLTASSLALGILVTYIIGAFVEWYWLSWIISVFPLVLLVGMSFMPETPVWLLANDQEDEARKALQRLRGRYISTILLSVKIVFRAFDFTAKSMRNFTRLVFYCIIQYLFINVYSSLIW